MTPQSKRSPTAPPGPPERSKASVETASNRRQLIDMARDNIAHSRAGNTPGQADGIMRVPASHYLDPERWAREVALFKRLPLMLALGGELREPSSYKAMTMMDVPVLLTRGSDGEVRAFVNMCSHRGAIVVPEGSGTARRFACPYHAWTYDHDGDLVGILDRERLRPARPRCHGLTPLPVAERAGLVFVVLTPGRRDGHRRHLCGYDDRARPLRLRRLAPRGPDARRGAELEGRLRRLPRLLPPADPAQEQLRTRLPQPGHLRRLGSAPAGDVPDPPLLDLEGMPEERVAHRASLRRRVDDLPPRLDRRRHRRRPRHPAVPRRRRRQRRSPSRPTSSPASPTRTSGRRREPQAEFLERRRPRRGLLHRLRIQRALATGAKEFLFGRNEAGGQRFHTLLAEQLTCNELTR